MAGNQPAPFQPEPECHPAQATSRWWCYVPRKRLICPVGHHFNNSWHPLESGLIRCDKWIAEEKRECGLWIFVYVVRGGKCVIAEVRQDEASHLSELTTPAEVIDYLQIFEQISVPNAASAPAGPSHHNRDRR
jgi:hypothetical protein